MGGQSIATVRICLKNYMKRFKDFGIKPSEQGFSGDKIKIIRILNREIIIHKYCIKDSNFEKGNGKCLYIQIEIGEIKHVVFTGSKILMDMIQKVPHSDFPFLTTIIKENERYEFT